MIHSSLIMLKDPLSLAAESYRMFRTNLSYINIDNENKIIMFTSSSAMEGKTTSACNAAIAIASTEKKVLLIDCDLRKPTIHQQFEFYQTPGLTNVLAQKENFEEAVNRVEACPNLHVLTAGVSPPNPSETMSSLAFERFINEIKDAYDFILLDAPPVLAVTDATAISRITDGVVLTVAAKKTRREDAKQAKKMLENVGAHILGVLLTKADVSLMKNYHTYYQASPMQPEE